MQTEIEAKFLSTDHDLIRARLKSLKAKQVHAVRLMRRKIFDYPDLKLQKKSGWVRVRDEGDKITLAYKQLNHRGLDGTKEISLEVSDFEATCKFLESIGLEEKSYQETKRESWLLDGSEIELDEWPWIDPFIEVEAPNEEKLIEVLKKLELDIKEAVHGSVEVAYQADFNLTEDEIDSWPLYTFGPVPKEWEKKRKHGIKTS